MLHFMPSLYLWLNIMILFYSERLLLLRIVICVLHPNFYGIASLARQTFTHIHTHIQIFPYFHYGRVHNKSRNCAVQLKTIDKHERQKSGFHGRL